MRRKLIIARPAARDISTVRQWLTQPGAGARAARRLAAIDGAIRELRKSPSRCPLGDFPGVRERPVEGYRIMYEVSPDTGDDATAGDVQILRVFGPFQDRSQL